MDYLAIAGVDLDRAHVACLLDGWAEYEVPVDVAARGGNGEGAFGSYDEIRFAQRRLGSGRAYRFALATRRALRYPIRDGLDLPIAKAQLTGEIAIAVLGKPRRHVAAMGHGRELRRALTHVFVSQEGKRPRFAGTMAGCAITSH